MVDIRKAGSRNEVFEIEINNFDKVIFYNSGNNFYNAVSHSSLFMLNLLNSKAKLHFYKGQNNKPGLSYISYNAKQFETLKADTISSKFEIIRNDDFLFVFKLKEPSTPEQVKKWENEEKAVRERIEQYFLPDNGGTKLYSAIRKLGAETAIAGDKMRANARQVYSKELLKIVVEMYRVYNSLREDQRNSSKVYYKLRNLLTDFSFLVALAFDSGIMKDIKQIERIAELTKEMAKLIKPK